MSLSAEIKAALRIHPIFRDADDAVINRLAHATSVHHFEPGEAVIRAGTAQQEIIILTEGCLHLFSTNPEEKTQLLVGALEPPAVFGDAEFYGNKPWMVSAHAANATVILTIKNATFDAVVSADAKIASRLYRDACARHMLVIEIMQLIGLERNQRLIMHVLSGMARDAASQVFRVSRIEVANAIGSNPKTVTRHLKDLEGRGFIQLLSRDRVQLMKTGAFSDPGLAGGLGAQWRLPRYESSAKRQDEDELDHTGATAALRLMSSNEG